MTAGPLPLRLRGGSKDKEKPNSRRMISIIAAREKGATYQEIGEEWGVSRERVRQLLMNVRPDLCGNHKVLGLAEYKTYKFRCAECGKPRTRKFARVKYCSRQCAGMAKREMEKLKAIYLSRLAGAKWADAGRPFFTGSDSYIRSRANKAVRRYAKYTGKDVSDAYGFHAT